MILDLTSYELPIVGVVTPQPTTLNIIGLPGPPGPIGPEGPQGPSGTIVAVGPTPPSSPNVNDLWVDTT